MKSKMNNSLFFVWVIAICVPVNSLRNSEFAINFHNEIIKTVKPPNEFFIEILVVTDKSMLDYYKEDLSRHVSHIFHSVSTSSRIFHFIFDSYTHHYLI